MAKAMKRELHFLLPLILWIPFAAQASNSTIYRCGNEYTNQVTRISKGGCVPLQGGAVSVVRNAGRGAVPAPRPPVVQPARATMARTAVNSQAQLARESQARAILKAELDKATQRLGELRREYNNGEPERIGGEARNHQKYLNRVADLRANIQRTESDIAGIQRELQRAGG